MNPAMSSERGANPAPISKWRNGPTIKDVARQVGVSHITVSRVMNGGANVEAGTAERVREAARALGYAPNMFARGLVRGASQHLGLLVADTTSPFIAELLRAVCAAADESGYVVNICVTGFSLVRELRALDDFIQHRVAGLVVGPAGFPESNARISELAERGIPVVAIQREIDHPAVNMIAGDVRRGSYRAATHLLELGHRRLGYITGTPDLRNTPEKLRGCIEALAAYNVRLDKSLVAESDFTPHGGYAAAQTLLRHPDPPTAIMAFNDTIAIGAMSAALCAGVRVPEDLSIVGFDDAGFAAYTNPALTTVRQPIADLGRLGARTLIDAVVSPVRPVAVRMSLDCSLIVRASTGSVRQ